ncbi:MAG: putative tellurium resistance membrane protein TerC [Verrucomicrobiales bacterium]|jgi:predicted tellurium resistance membrane protein TerC
MGPFEIITTLVMLVLLQAVLGFDNLLYISLESRRAPAADQARVRKIGIAIAVILRIVLLFVLFNLVKLFKDPFWTFGNAESGWIAGSFSVEAMIVLLGGLFILYTAVKEIFHMLALHNPSLDDKDRKPASAKSVIAMIVVMNLVFSFDSILSAMALTDESTTGFILMASAIIAGGLLMIWLADRVSTFLQKNRMYEVLGLFILLLVGILLISEGGEKAHLHFFGHAIEPMSKATFYFVLVILIITDVVQSRYQRKLLAKQAAEAKH